MFSHNFLDELLKNDNIVRSKSIGEDLEKIIIYKEKNEEYTWNYIFLDNLEENQIKFSIKSSFRETLAPKWPLELISSIKSNLEKYYINIKHGDVICIEDFRNQCNLAGFIFIKEKKDNLYSLVPILEKELYFLELIGSKKIIELLYKTKNNWSNLNRSSIVEEIDINQFYSPDIEFNKLSEEKYRLVIGIDDYKFIQYNFLDKLLIGETISLIGEEVEINLSMKGSFGVEVEDNNKYSISLSKTDLDSLKNTFNIQNINNFNLKVSNLEITLKKTYFRNNTGEIVG